MCESRGIMGDCACMFFHGMLARLNRACSMIQGLGKFCLSHGMAYGSMQCYYCKYDLKTF